MKRILFVSVIGLLAFSVNAQSWQRVNESSIALRGEKKITPQEFTLAELDDKEMKEALWRAPLESRITLEEGAIIPIMLKDGSIDQFEVFEYSMMEAGLAQKFPDFKTFIGQSINDEFRKIRIDYTSKGFRAVVSDENGQTYIDPYQENDNQHRIIYKRSDATLNTDWTCRMERETKPASHGSGERIVGDCSLRTFRLAVAATGEYTAFHGGTVVSGQAAIVTAINRVNQIYEQELAVRMLLVANNNLLVYTNGGSDPYTNNDGFALLGQNQTNVDNIIGTGNYDIGHVFSTGGGGVASLGSLCETSFKARGVTGLPQPVGDPFYIDFVCHEIGHQFGGPHTFNGTVGNCSGGNRSQANSYEPGSGTTIMAYAGICGSDNIQNNSDPYFHSKSLELMSAEINQNDCSGSLAFTNNPPQLLAVSNVNVPASTPLLLDASASDGDSDVLNYCWEQIDADGGNPSLPSPTKTTGPLFRSLPPTTDTKRYLPSIDNVINNSADPWEVLPSVSRDMNFRVTVRDKSLEPGCTDEEDITITVDGNSGPFLVTNSSVPSTVNEAAQITLQWDVAGTDQAPVNCDNVEIRLSRDGGLTYPTIVLASTPNDGSELITIPNGIASNARLMVKGVDNIFFDINDSDFEIEPGLDGFSIALDPASLAQCNDEVVEFDIVSTSFGGFSTPIDLTITGQPAGAVVNYSANPLTPGSSSTVTISNLLSSTGDFTLDVEGSAAAIVRNQSFALSLSSNTIAPNLVSPANNSVDITLSPQLTWTAANSADTYEYELRTGANGGGSLIQGGITSTTTIDIASALSPNTSYFWRVRSIGICNTSNFSSDFTFRTANVTEVCQTFAGINLPVSIARDFDFDPNTGAVTFATIPVALDGIITDVNVLNITGTHPRVGDLAFFLVSPADSVILLQDFFDCGREDDFDMGFDDESNTSVFDCPPNQGKTYQPFDELSIVDGDNANGDWRIAVLNFGRRGGSISSISLEICSLQEVAPCNLNVTSTAASGPGSLQNAINCAGSGDIITINTGANSTIDLAGTGLSIGKNLTIQANPSDNVKIRYSGNESALEVLENFNLTISGISFEQVNNLRELRTIEIDYSRVKNK